MSPLPATSTADFLVACFCAQWCGTCREYQPQFEALAAQFPQATFRWVDIEDEAEVLEALDDLDVENFPTVMIQRGEHVLYLGVMLPHISLLQRLIETFVAQSPAESAHYASSQPERAAWQGVLDLRSALNN